LNELQIEQYVSGEQHTQSRRIYRDSAQRHLRLVNDYTLFLILVSGLREIFSRQVKFRDFCKFSWKSALVVVEKYSNITIMYLQRRRKVFLFEGYRSKRGQVQKLRILKAI
jgi:hypothetical protein